MRKLIFIWIGVMVLLTMQVFADTRQELLDNIIFSYHLYNATHDNSSTPIEGEVSQGNDSLKISPECLFNTSSCWKGINAGDDDYVDFNTTGDLSAITDF